MAQLVSELLVSISYFCIYIVCSSMMAINKKLKIYGLILLGNRENMTQK